MHISGPQLHDKAPEIPALTGLRFLAAFTIMYAHTLSYALRSADGKMHDAGLLTRLESLSNLGMTLFFVLSGFVIHYNYSDTIRKGWRGIHKFAVARFARLYPLYLLFLALDISEYPAEVLHHPWILLPYLTLTQAWAPSFLDHTLFSHLMIAGAWSISVEVALYFLYIPLCSLISSCHAEASAKHRLAGFMAAATGGFLLIWLFVLHAETTAGAPVASLFGVDLGWLLYASPLCRLPEFIAGALAAQYVRSSKGTLSFSPWMGWAGSGACLLLFLAGWPEAGARANHLSNMAASSWGYAIGSVLIILSLSKGRTPAATFFGSRPLVALGDASYSLYLSHGYLNYLFASFSSWLGFALKIILTWIFNFIISMGIFQVYEVPARTWLRRALMSGDSHFFFSPASKS